MRSPKPAKEDPAVVSAREREERRAESARTEETQALLMGATQRRLRRFGRVAAGSGGSVPIYGGSGGGGAGGGGVSGGGLNMGGGGRVGGSGDGNSAPGSRPSLNPVLY